MRISLVSLRGSSSDLQAKLCLNWSETTVGGKRLVAKFVNSFCPSLLQRLYQSGAGPGPVLSSTVSSETGGYDNSFQQISPQPMMNKDNPSSVPHK